MSYRATAFAAALPELAAPGCTPERLAHLEEHGFVIITDFVGHPFIPLLREAGRRVTEACAPEHGYGKIDASKGYVHRAAEEEPWAIRGLIHPAFGEPSFAEFHGSPDFLRFVHSWCHGLRPEEMVLSGMLLWCNPRRNEHKLSWHRDVTWWGTGKPYFAQREVRGEGPEAYSEEIERTRWQEIQAENAKSLAERNGVSMFLALVDDECHELIPGSHRRWRTPFEHDVPPPASDEGPGGAVHAKLEWHGFAAAPGRDPAPGGGSPHPQRGHHPHGPHGPRARAQHALHRLVAVVGPVHRGAGGGGRAQRVAARSRRARRAASRVDEDGVGPLGRHAAARRDARGPLRAV